MTSLGFRLGLKLLFYSATILLCVCSGQAKVTPPNVEKKLSKECVQGIKYHLPTYINSSMI